MSSTPGQWFWLIESGPSGNRKIEKPSTHFNIIFQSTSKSDNTSKCWCVRVYVCMVSVTPVASLWDHVWSLAHGSQYSTSRDTGENLHLYKMHVPVYQCTSIAWMGDHLLCRWLHRYGKWSHRSRGRIVIAAPLTGLISETKNLNKVTVRRDPIKKK